MNPDNRFFDPELYCPKGHVIPRNGAHGPSGGLLNAPLLACPLCAIKASEGLPPLEKRKPMAKPEELRKLGQADIFDMPTIEIR